MAEFFKVFTMKGFDRWRMPRWQMVPAGKYRYVALRDAAGATVASSDPSVVTCEEITTADLPGGTREPLQANDRILKLKGIRRGAAKITAMGPGCAPGELEIGVKNRKTVQVVYNFVRDAATPAHQTIRVPASAAQWSLEMNYIFNGQANVYLNNKAARWVDVPKDLGADIITTTSGVGEEADLYPLGDSATGVINFFFVWSMDITDDPDDEDAFTEGRRIVFEDTAGAQLTETMAHEVGHALGLPDNYVTKRQLMYGITDDRGVDLPKAHVNIINP